MASTAHGRNNFDLVRLAAAAQVVWVHATTHLGVSLTAPLRAFDAVLQTFPGVPAFFVVSGFLITDAWLRDPDAHRYAINRALRIFPALWVCFAGAVLLVLAFGHGPAMASDSPRLAFWVAAQLTVLQPYNLPALRDFGVGVLNGSLWTIPVELQFYLALPLLLALPRRLLVAAALASAAVFAVVEGARPLPLANRVLLLTLAPHLFGFLLGAFARLYRARIMPLLEGRFLRWLLLHLAAQAALWSLGLHDAPWAVAMTRPLLAAVVLAGAFTRHELAARLLRGHDISYGLYLWHMIVINALVELGLLGAWRHVALAAVLAVLAAMLSWRLVERPALSLKRRPVRPTAPPAG
jgi:peptidoglycan/LPS O-acetylase OafA/YrhL